MAGETVITIVGNLVGDPELRFTPAGAAVANFTVASTPRNFNRDTGQWEDGPALFLRCAAWREMAEHTAESLGKGTRVVVQGRLRQRSYETSEGSKRTVVELEVDEVAPSLRYATAKVTRSSRSGQGGDRGGRGSGWHTRGPGTRESQQHPVADPWATGSTPPGHTEEPPF